MTVEPPLPECVVCQRGNRSVVIRESLLRDVEPEHARVPYRCSRNVINSGEMHRFFLRQLLTNMSVYTGDQADKGDQEGGEKHDFQRKHFKCPSLTRGAQNGEGGGRALDG